MKWKLVEQYEKPVAVVVVFLAIAVLVSVAVGPNPPNPNDIVTEIRKSVTPKLWVVFPVKSGDCYSIGDDEGWVAADCMTRDEAKKHADSMNAQQVFKSKHEQKTWTKVK